MGRGRRRTAMADNWTRILDAQIAAERRQAGAAVQPSQHIGASWCEHGWQCSACPGATDARPDPSADHSEERD